MAQDIVVTLGLEDRAFRDSLRKSGGYSKRAAWQIGKDFERAERMRERAGNRSVESLLRGNMRLDKGLRLVSTRAVGYGAAITAGWSLANGALSAAGRQNEELAAKIAETGGAWEDFKAAIGEDISLPMISLRRSIKGVSQDITKARRDMVNFVAAVGTGSSVERMQEVDRTLAHIESMRTSFGRRRAVEELDLDIGGREDDPDAGLRRSMRDRINQTTDDRAERARLHASALRAAERREREREQSARRAREATRARAGQDRLDDTAQRLGSVARRRPEDYRAQQDAINAAAAARRQRVSDEVMGDESIPEADKLDIISRKMLVIGAEQARQLEAARDQNEANQRRIAQLDNEQRIMVASQRIDLARAQGRDREADAMQVALNFEERRLRIINDQSLSEERRRQLLGGEEQIFNAQMGRLGRTGARRGSGSGTIGPGFAGDAATRNQVVSSQSEGRQLVDLTRSANAILEEIRRNTQGDTVARAG